MRHITESKICLVTYMGTNFVLCSYPNKLQSLFMSNCPQANMLKVQSNNLKITDRAFLGCSPKLN